MPERVSTKFTVSEDEYDSLRSSGNEIQDLLDFHIDRLSLQAEPESMKSQRTSIHSLPVELLCRVFVLVVEPHDSMGDTAFDTRPVCLSHVCRRWREVALGTPILWRSIHFYHFDLFSPSKSLPDCVTAFLQRRQKVTLDIVLSNDETDPWIPESYDIIRTTASCLGLGLYNGLSLLIDTHNVRCISTTCCTMLLVDLFLQLLCKKDRFSSLASLDLRPTSTSFYRWFSTSITTFFETSSPFAMPSNPQSLPSLQYLSLHGIPFEFIPVCDFPSLLEFSFARPRNIATEDQYQRSFKISHLAQLLASAPNLEKLSFINAGPYVDVELDFDTSIPPSFWDHSSAWSRQSPRKIPPLVLRNLKEFVWIGVDSLGLYAFLAYFPSPNLELLDVKLFAPTQNSLYWSDFILHDVYQASPHSISPTKLVSLNCLHVQSSSVSAMEMIVGLLDIPSVETVSITNTEIKLLPSGYCILPDLPRSDNIFFDPRLLHLTSLALSAFTFTSEHIASMLCYLRTLRVLQCDMMDGMDILLEKLAETCVLPNREFLSMRYCPRLEELRLWECGRGLRFERLEEVVSLRSGLLKEEMRIQKSTRQLMSGNTGASASETRKIKLLKRRAMMSVGGSASSSTGVTTPQSRRVVALMEAQEAAKVKRVSIVNCDSVWEEEARSLEKWGVEVDWSA